MKTIQTTVSTGTKINGILNNESVLNGEIGTIKNGKITIFWLINKTSGFSQHLSTKELNKQIKEGKIKISTN